MLLCSTLILCRRRAVLLSVQETVEEMFVIKNMKLDFIGYFQSDNYNFITANGEAI